MLVLENRRVYYKVLRKLYGNNKFNISLNFNFVLSAS